MLGCPHGAWCQFFQHQINGEYHFTPVWCQFRHIACKSDVQAYCLQFLSTPAWCILITIKMNLVSLFRPEWHFIIRQFGLKKVMPEWHKNEFHTNAGWWHHFSLTQLTVNDSLKSMYLYSDDHHPTLYRVEICFDTVLMLTILHCNTIYILNSVRKCNLLCY